MTRKRRVNRSRPTAHEHALEPVARLGFTARGVTYILIGLLALAIVIGEPAPAADRTGALQVIADQPLGKVLLWLLSIGFGAMALWRLAQVVYGVKGDRHHGAAEAISLCRAVIYGVFCVGTLHFVLEDRLPQSTDEQSRDFTTKAMAHSGGRQLVMLVGVVIVAIGLYMLRQGITQGFLKELQLGDASRQTRAWVDRLGVIGNVARGVVFAAIGVFMIVAAVHVNPGEAKGLDATLRTFAHTPLGPWLLAVVGAGLAVFGTYSLCEARWHRHV